jgi:acylphosphatase
MQRVSVTVSGRVQGVGYRLYAVEQAREYGITGWVRNEPDGDVAVEAQGSRKRLDAFCDALAEGPAAGHVTDVVRVEIPVVDGDRSFTVRY